MKRVRLRKIVKRESEEAPPRVPKGLLWTLLTLLVLVAVWQYDKHGQQVAQQHIAKAEAALRRTDVTAAISEYRQALENPRLSRQKKAVLAIKIAELYETGLNDPELALAFYNRARRYHPKSTDRPEIKAKMTELRVRLATQGHFVTGVEGEETTHAEEVRLLSPPPEDFEGPVIARIGTTEIRAAAFARYVRQRSTLPAVLLKPEDPKLAQWWNDFINRETAYRAAIAEGMHLRPGIIAQLYDYQRTLLSQQLLAEQREKVKSVSEEEIRQFYEKHIDRFKTPARIALGAIANTTETALLDAKQYLKQGASWRDIVTSCCTHSELLQRDGLVGALAANAESIPQFGEAKELIPQLFGLKARQTLGPIKRGDYYWLFIVFQNFPEEKQSFDEVRGQIELTLRSEKVGRTEQQLREDLRSRMKVSTEPNALEKVIEYLKTEETSTTPSVERSERAHDNKI